MHIKIHQFVPKNSQNAGVDRAKKSISVYSLYTNEVTDCLKSAGISGHRVKYGLDHFLDHFLDYFLDHFLDHFIGGGSISLVLREGWDVIYSY